MSSTGVAESSPVFQSITVGAVDGLTAHAGGGQATLLYRDPATGAANSGALNPAVASYRLTTVASANDSATLPPSQVGSLKVVTNAAASNSANIYPAPGDAINALGANQPFALAAGKTALFICTAAGQYHSILTA
jgi:hypothetical protein